MDTIDPDLYYKYTLFDYFVRQYGGKKKWTTLIHNGVMFPSPYVQHHIPVIYNGQKINLQKEAEMYATLYARYTDTDYIKSATFRKNFWKDWKKILTKASQIESLQDCDFSLIYNHLIKLKEEEKNLSKEEKNKRKELRQKEEEKYKIAMIDGTEQQVGNFRIEPPGIFIGRGCHPKIGSIKPIIYPENITLNLSKNAPIPDLPDYLKDHKWGSIVHENDKEWLATWIDYVTGKNKYVWLGNNSHLKTNSDLKKFELARKLAKIVKNIREINDKNLQSSDIKMKQISTIVYFIDTLAVRMGNEKKEDQAQTYGISSLLSRHVKLLDDNKIEFNFLGKDSIEYKNIVQIPDTIYNNMKTFTDDKTENIEIFDQVTTSDVNKYLQEFMKGLTGKVFRTMNASVLFQSELKKISKKVKNITDDYEKVNLLLDGFNKANLRVALLCNHQKAVSKNFDNSMKKMDDKIKDMKKKLKEMKKKYNENKTEKNLERLKKMQNRLIMLRAQKNIKIDLKSISTSTSLLNYIDPRLVLAFIKKHDLPIDKVYSKALQNKFAWAGDVDDKFKY